MGDPMELRVSRVLSAVAAMLLLSGVAFVVISSPSKSPEASDTIATALIASHCETTLSTSASSAVSCQSACQQEAVCQDSRVSCSSSFTDSGPLSPTSYCSCHASGPCTKEFSCKKELQVSSFHDAASCSSACATQTTCGKTGIHCSSQYTQASSLDPRDRCNCLASGACTPELLPDSCSQQLPETAGTKDASSCQEQCQRQSVCQQAGNRCTSRFVPGYSLDPTDRCYCTATGPCTQ